jgi:hypothetical protein
MKVENVPSSGSKAWNEQQSTDTSRLDQVKPATLSLLPGHPWMFRPIDEPS